MAGDDLRLGIEVQGQLETDPPSLRVYAIPWDSGFYGTGLRVHDDIVAIDGEALVSPTEMRELQVYSQRLPGGPSESLRWSEAGRKAGDLVTLKVRRRRRPGMGWEELDLTGTLRPDEAWYNAEGRMLLGEDGPDQYASEDFGVSWMNWWSTYDEAAKKAHWWTWSRSPTDSAFALKEHLTHEERVNFLAQKYPGRFSARVKEQWEELHTFLSGTIYDITPADLEFRRVGDARAEEVRVIADQARQEFLAAHASDVIPAFPAVHPVTGDRDAVVGRIVVLDPIRGSEWVSDLGHNYLCKGGSDGWYFIDAESPVSERMRLAYYRYERIVSPDIAMEYAVIGRITDDLRLLVNGGAAVWGVLVEPVAATIGGAAFVDLTVEQDGISMFAGEADMRLPSVAPVADDASPAQVVESLVAAVKAGDEGSWTRLFATWRAVDLGGSTMYYPMWAERAMTDRWVASRRLLEERVADVRVLWTGDPVPLPLLDVVGMPLVEEVDVEVDHVCDLDGRYRSYSGVAVNRFWKLQRIDGGPWRITTVQSI